MGNIWALCFSKPQSMRVRLKIWVNDSSEKGKTCVLEPWVSGLWGRLGEASRPHVRLSRTQPEPNAFIFRHEYVCVQSCPTLCDPMDCNQPGSSVHGILQARILECVAVSSCRGSSNPRIKPTSLESPVLAGIFFTTVPPGKPSVFRIWTLILKSVCRSGLGE